jgi:hypothetical protein
MAFSMNGVVRRASSLGAFSLLLIQRSLGWPQMGEYDLPIGCADGQALVPAGEGEGLTIPTALNVRA